MKVATVLRRAGVATWAFLKRDRKALVGSIVLVVLFIIAAFPSWFTPDNPAAEIYTPGLGPSGSHLLGTTSLGQDIFSQLMAGTRQSVLIALLVGLFSTVASVIIGVTAAYFGGVIDDLLSLFTDVVLVILTFPLIITVVTG